MKYIKSKCLQEAKGRKRGKYLITLEVSDYDLEMFENFATSYTPFELNDKINIELNKLEDYSKMSEIVELLSVCDYNKKYRKWIINVWSTFWTLWHKHDKY